MPNQIDKETVYKIADSFVTEREGVRRLVPYKDLPAFANAILAHMQEGNEAIYQICFDGNGNWVDVPSCEYEKESFLDKRVVYTSPPNTQAKLDKAIEALKLLKDATCISERADDFGQLQKWVNKIASKALADIGEDNG